MHSPWEIASLKSTLLPKTPASPCRKFTNVSASLTAQLQFGMQMNDVNTLLGQARQLSESTSPEGLKKQVFEYFRRGQHVELIYLDGMAVRFSIVVN